MSYEVIPTKNFEKKLKKLKKKYAQIGDDVRNFSNKIDEFIKSGEPIGMDCHKIRMQITGKNAGKSGGARVILQAKVVAQKVFLLTIYDKGDRETITDKEITKLLKQI